jgi:UDP-N-acetyl-alpha-D-muramoyl-L-alanyl-L-glutamate epimerase
MKYKEFVFENYHYDPSTSTLSLHYRFDERLHFEEKLFFEFVSQHITLAASDVLDRIFRLIFLLSGVSYYKAFIPKLLVCEAFEFDQHTGEFLHKFYEKGLAEFAYRNGISLRDHFYFRSSCAPAPPPIAINLSNRALVPVGGGKDSIVTIECLKETGQPLILFALGDADPINACIATADLPCIRVRRLLDETLFELNRTGALNGHVPITGILSAIALAGAVMSGCNAVVMSNEHSASAPNLKFDGIDINHQYSKSFEFEQDFGEYVERFISPGIQYFSLLRPFSEIEIARRFSKLSRYFGVFRSCNTAFRQTRAARGRHWCGRCPKCRFVFLALAPFLPKQELIGIFGRNLLDDPAQCDGFAELCGLQQHKPFECVGETSECAAVLAYLGGSPEWRRDSVVQQLHGRFPPVSETTPAEYHALFELRQPHRVPDSYMPYLNACG